MTLLTPLALFSGASIFTPHWMRRKAAVVWAGEKEKSSQSRCSHSRRQPKALHILHQLFEWKWLGEAELLMKFLLKFSSLRQCMWVALWTLHNRNFQTFSIYRLSVRIFRPEMRTLMSRTISDARYDFAFRDIVEICPKNYTKAFSDYTKAFWDKTKLLQLSLFTGLFQVIDSSVACNNRFFNFLCPDPLLSVSVVPAIRRDFPRSNRWVNGADWMTTRRYSQNLNCHLTIKAASFLRRKRFLLAAAFYRRS